MGFLFGTGYIFQIGYLQIVFYFLNIIIVFSLNLIQQLIPLAFLHQFDLLKEQ